MLFVSTCSGYDFRGSELSHINCSGDFDPNMLFVASSSGEQIAAFPTSDFLVCFAYNSEV